MNIQKSEEFKTSKFFCKTDFVIGEIKQEEASYVPLPKFSTFKSRDERERILDKNFVQVGQDVKEMIQGCTEQAQHEIATMSNDKGKARIACNNHDVIAGVSFGHKNEQMESDV